MTFNQQLEQIRNHDGFIAALDQSGGSTPKALRLYGIDDNEYSNDTEMFAYIHQMRSRIITSQSFDSNRILGAILFEMTMNSKIQDMGSAQYLWQQKQVVPFLKVDKGIEKEKDGIQKMKPIPNLDELLQQAKQNEIFGTKMRSVIKNASNAGVKAIVEQQFDIGLKIIEAGLVPIIEPEVDINSKTKSQAEEMLLEHMMVHIERLNSNQLVMLKLSIPDKDNFYEPCIKHPNVIKVVALSGGYNREDANAKLSRNNGMTASFSRALTEGLTAQQSNDEFIEMLDTTIESIFQASKT